MQVLESVKKKTGLTQKEIAEVLGVQETYLSHIKAGKRSPSRKLEERLNTMNQQDGDAGPSHELKDSGPKYRTGTGELPAVETETPEGRPLRVPILPGEFGLERAVMAARGQVPGELVAQWLEGFLESEGLEPGPDVRRLLEAIRQRAGVGPRSGRR